MVERQPDTKPQNSPDHTAAYSQRITRLRRLLPLIALLLFGLLVLASNPDFTRQTGGEGVASSDRLVINRPVFAGRLNDGRPYLLKAEQGRQQTNGDVALRAADLTLDATAIKPSLSFVADQGFYKSPTGPEAGAASLSGNVVVKTGDGNVVRTQQLDMDVTNGNWQAPEGAGMDGPSGALTAKRMAADETLGVYHFENVTMRLQRQTAEAK